MKNSGSLGNKKRNSSILIPTLYILKYSMYIKIYWTRRLLIKNINRVYLNTVLHFTYLNFFILKQELQRFICNLKVSNDVFPIIYERLKLVGVWEYFAFSEFTLPKGPYQKVLK